MTRSTFKVLFYVNGSKEHLKLSEEEFKEIADKIYTEFKKL